MAYYTTYGELQSVMTELCHPGREHIHFRGIVKYLYEKGLLREYIPFPSLNYDYDSISDEAFDRLIDSLPLSLSIAEQDFPYDLVEEQNMIPDTRDVFVIRHPKCILSKPHIHNYFEINYVAYGTATLFFEEEERRMQEGELCIIAPGSLHTFYTDENSCVFSLCLRQSTFDTTFFSLMSQKDLLSYFFRTILRGDGQPNYLLFFSRETRFVTQCFRHMIVESCLQDAYSNTCCISYVNLMFSTLLRTYSQTIQFYNYQTNTDFSLVLKYIQHNYQTLTLSALAEFFHYSEPHLCSLIKQNTGFTFTGLLKRLRLSYATDYLTNTSLKISEIADMVGYHSADHFSRVFRSTYRMSPQEYRRQNRNQNPGDDFHPFL